MTNEQIQGIFKNEQINLLKKSDKHHERFDLIGSSSAQKKKLNIEKKFAQSCIYTISLKWFNNVKIFHSYFITCKSKKQLVLHEEINLKNVREKWIFSWRMYIPTW